MKQTLSLIPFALLAACSSQSSSDAEPAAEETVSVTPATPMAPEKTAYAPAPVPSATTLTLTGLDDLRIGEKVSADHS